MEKVWRGNEACQAERVVFQPLPFEVLGGVHDTAAGVIRRLGQSLACAGGLDDREVTKHLFGRLSILLMKGSAQLILSRCPNHNKPRIDGHM